MNGYQNFNNSYPTGGYIGGMMYQETPKLAMTQGLTKEQLNSLRKTGGFTLEVSEEDLLKSYCTHRVENKFMVAPDEEGNYVCSLCGTKFKIFEGDTTEARHLVDRIIDLLETTKMQSISLPPQTIQNFFQIEPILKKLPELYIQSRNDYNRVLGPTDGYMYGQENNGFAVYQNMINPVAGNGYYDPAMMNMQQPMYGQQMQQPMYGQPNMMPQQPMYGQQIQQPMYGQPNMMPQQPMYGQQMQQPNMMPQQQQQGNPFSSNPTPVANTNNNNNNATNNQDTVTVSKKLTD